MGPADLHLFTDGAADGGTERGGGSVVVFDGGRRLRGSPSRPEDTAAPSLLRRRRCWRCPVAGGERGTACPCSKPFRGEGGCRVEDIRRELWDLYDKRKQVGLA